MKWSVSFAVAGIIALLLVLSRVDSELPTRVQAQKLLTTEVDRLVLTRFDKNGKKLETSRAAQALQFEGETQTHLQDVSVERQDRNGTRWQLNSPVGMSESASDTLTLTGGVTILRGNDVRLETQELTVDATTNLASSLGSAKLLSSRGTAVASRLIVDLDAGTAELRGDVTSRYQKESIQ